MNTFKAVVTKIQSVDSLNIVSFDFNGESLSMMSLDLGEEIKEGVEVELTAKPTHVALAKDLSGELSYSNRIKAKIHKIENGELLSNIHLRVKDIFLESIITLKSSNRMALKVDDEVSILIKASELSIVRVV